MRVIEVDRREEDDHQVDALRSYMRGLHCGLIPSGGFIEDEEPEPLHRQAYDIISESNAANYLARRDLEQEGTWKI